MLIRLAESAFAVALFAVRDTGVGIPKEEQEREFTQVDMSYLDGALFIGDSRTSTLAEYAGWDQTDFFVEYGLTIWDVMDEVRENW